MIELHLFLLSGGFNSNATALTLSTTSLATGSTARSARGRSAVEGGWGGDWNGGRSGGHGPDGEGHVRNGVVVT